MQVEHNFMWIAANHFSEMRLMAEGAIALYENHATGLCRMALLTTMKRRSPSMTLEKPCMRFAVIWRSCKLHFIRHPFLMIQRVKRKHLVSMTLSKSQKGLKTCQKCKQNA